MSSTTEVESLVRVTLAKACSRDVGEIGLQTTVAELGVDSLAFSALIARVEAEFSMDLTPAQQIAIYEARQVDEIVSITRAAVGQHTAG